MRYNAGEFDVAVIGAGHAGIEAALVCARMGLKTLCATINLDAVGNLPCNPSIGGTAKGHLVRELDALGGEMGRAADHTCIQFRMLNRSKGPAVYSPRAQADRAAYRLYMKNALECCENLSLKQAEIVEILTREENGKKAVDGVVTHIGAIYKVKAAIVCTGTYLKSKIIIGDVQYESGPDGLFPANKLTDCLCKLGLPLVRFKTGTPARVNARSVDFSVMELQEGDKEQVRFSFDESIQTKNTAVCYLTHTNEETHKIIRENLHRSPLYSGQIKGVGVRYCPSIEDKVVRFADKERHPLFMEPMGLGTQEMYVQGLSSSMPEDVQMRIIRSVKGLENVEVMRPAYAIEYDCVDPTALYPTLETKLISGLYGAGQFNGTSGYEEAAVQGFMAGVNAACKILGRDSVIIDRSQAYIGTLIDDLVTKGTNEPYRMMTSRSEYRLILRQDNADIRMSEIGHSLGLISDERHERVLKKYETVEGERERLEKTNIPPSAKLSKLLEEKNSAPVTTGIKLADLVRRPELKYDELKIIDPDRPELSDEIREQVEISVKYEGYIRRQTAQAEQFKKTESRRIPEDIDYTKINVLRLEARQKLQKIRPANIGQASRISGVSPADIAALMIWIEQRRK
ncbi:MAG: tRNA uridine-5-carboxymethylaminomethyl(34) synthesis enzyme MnmG [Clostridiales bacterium]|nr:tRNA uridine-5-carboxymethylaminomethyl(34) synthesis enzyme MnmG [Clostridiales bacterium]